MMSLAQGAGACSPGNQLSPGHSRCHPCACRLSTEVEGTSLLLPHDVHAATALCYPPGGPQGSPS